MFIYNVTTRNNNSLLFDVTAYVGLTSKDVTVIWGMTELSS